MNFSVLLSTTSPSHEQEVGAGDAEPRAEDLGDVVLSGWVGRAGASAPMRFAAPRARSRTMGYTTGSLPSVMYPNLGRSVSLQPASARRRGALGVQGVDEGNAGGEAEGELDVGGERELGEHRVGQADEGHHPAADPELEQRRRGGLEVVLKRRDEEGGRSQGLWG